MYEQLSELIESNVIMRFIYEHDNHGCTVCFLLFVETTTTGPIFINNASGRLSIAGIGGDCLIF
jgi:hypothetical protein